MTKTERRNKPCRICGKRESEHPGGRFCQPPKPESTLDWEVGNVGAVVVHSLVIGGVLCRWWGEEEPVGASLLLDFARQLEER
jgi:hypothetical protein